MNEIPFVVEAADGGCYRARAIGAAIHTEADSLEGLHREIRDAVLCHFDAGEAPPSDPTRSRAPGTVGPGKIPRDLNGADLARRLETYGYRVSRQSGNHSRLTRDADGRQQHLTVSAHKPLRVGILRQILKDVA